MTSVDDPNIYATGEKHDRWLYDFRCPACNACGDLGLPKAAKSMECPEKCGAMFVQWTPPGHTKVALRCINLFSTKMRIEADLFHARRNKVNGS